MDTSAPSRDSRSGPDDLLEPLDAAVSGDGRTLAGLDSGNRRVQTFSAAGSRVGGFRIVPPNMRANAIAHGRGGTVLLNQPALGNVVSVYSRSGKAMKAFGLCAPGGLLIGERIGFRTPLEYRPSAVGRRWSVVGSLRVHASCPEVHCVRPSGMASAAFRSAGHVHGSDILG